WGDDLLDRLAHDLARLLPGAHVEAAQRALEHAGRRDGVGGRARLHGTPREGDARARVEAAAQHGGGLRDDLAAREDDVAGQVRARGVPAGRRDGHDHRVARRGDGADARADVRDVELRVAVQRRDAVDAVELGGAVDDVLRTTGEDLLGRLEEQAHAAAQAPLLVQPRADETGT